MVVVIPAYEPDRRLIDLIREIRAAADVPIVVVNDGSGPVYDSLFHEAAALGCHVVAYGPNRGKGHALKRGFAFIQEWLPGEGVVTADADGQHTVEDILMIGDRLAGRDKTIVLGTRSFAGPVPVRSRIGNRLTRVIFSRSTGTAIGDTQTGLRAYPPDLLDWLSGLPGQRFEYELIVLLEAVEKGYAIEEVPIDTIYLAANRSSHFRPIADSARVYLPLLKFSLSSLSAFVLDFILLLTFQAVSQNLLLSVVAARVISSVFNYLANRQLVFARGRETSIWKSAAGYFSLVLTLMGANYGLMFLLYEMAGFPLVISKVTTEALLFAVSYQTQHRVIFSRGAGREEIREANEPRSITV